MVSEADTDNGFKMAYSYFANRNSEKAVSFNTETLEANCTGTPIVIPLDG